jgi:outer membrane usher protein FimD/PapC
MSGWIAVKGSEYCVSLTLIKRLGLKVERIKISMSSATNPCLLLRGVQQSTAQSDPAVLGCYPEKVDI